MPITVDWFNIFEDLNIDIGADQIPKKLNSGFIFIIKVNSSYYAMTGGLEHNHLKKSLEIEHKFGIDISEKILSLPEIRGLAQKDTSGSINALDRVFRGKYNPNGDINNLKRVLTHVRGKLKNNNVYYDIIGKSIIASDSLIVNGAKDLNDIIRFLISVNELWNRNTRQIKIPQLEFINKKFYPDLILNLDKQLARTICGYSHEDNSLFLDNEDIGYLPDRVIKYQILYKRRKYDCETYQDVFRKISGLLNQIADSDIVSELHKISLRVHFDDDQDEKRELYYFICGDVTYDNEFYFINNKYWYRASNDFVHRLDEEINNIEFISPEEINLSEWGNEDEDTYNIIQEDFICLHKKLVKIDSERGGIEFCDLLGNTENNILLIHIKKDCGAALRALFAQGFVSAKLYDEDSEFRTKIYNAELYKADPELTNDQKQYLRNLNTKYKRQIKIIFAMFDPTPSHTVLSGGISTSDKLNGVLSTFAKVDLLDRANSLRGMGYNVAVSRIKPYPE